MGRSSRVLQSRAYGKVLLRKEEVRTELQNGFSESAQNCKTDFQSPATKNLKQIEKTMPLFGDFFRSSQMFFDSGSDPKESWDDRNKSQKNCIFAKRISVSKINRKSSRNRKIIAKLQNHRVIAKSSRNCKIIAKSQNHREIAK